MGLLVTQEVEDPNAKQQARNISKKCSFINQSSGYRKAGDKADKRQGKEQLEGRLTIVSFRQEGVQVEKHRLVWAKNGAD